MGILLWIILGGIAGWIASMITGNDAEMGIFGNIIAGVVGAILGGVIMGLLGFEGVTNFNIRSLLVAVVGAVILLMLVNAFRRGRRGTV